MAEKAKSSPIFWLVPLLFVAALVIAGFFLYQNSFTQTATNNAPVNQVVCTQDAMQCPDGSYVGRTGPDCQFAACPAATLPTGWKMYKDDEFGFQFSYPEKFDTTFADLSFQPIAITQSRNITSGGCYVLNDGSHNPYKTSVAVINNVSFCLSETSDPGAGQLYHEYDYTMLHNGNYVTLQYIVHTSNGCSVYIGTPKYQDCTDFMNNYNTVVLKPIQDSVATLTFTK